MIITKFSLPFPVQSHSRSPLQKAGILKDQSKLLHCMSADTLDLSFRGGASNQTRDLNDRRSLKEKLGLSAASTESIFQKARENYLTECGLEDWADNKAGILQLLDLPENSSKGDMERFLKGHFEENNPELEQQVKNFLCELILAYPQHSPFEFPGRKLGG